MWNVAVVMPCAIAQSTVRRKTSRSSRSSAEDEAAVDHDAEPSQAADRLGVVAPRFCRLPRRLETARVERLEPDEQAAQAGRRGPLEEVRVQDGLHRGRPLEDAPHAAHPLEEFGREAGVREEMVVEEIEVTAGKRVDLGERLVHALRVERAPAGEEAVLVAEVAVVRAAARDGRCELGTR